MTHKCFRWCTLSTFGCRCRFVNESALSHVFACVSVSALASMVYVLFRLLSTFSFVRRRFAFYLADVLKFLLLIFADNIKSCRRRLLHATVSGADVYVTFGMYKNPYFVIMCVWVCFISQSDFFSVRFLSLLNPSFFVFGFYCFEARHHSSTFM